MGGHDNDKLERTGMAVGKAVVAAVPGGSALLGLIEDLAKIWPSAAEELKQGGQEITEDVLLDLQGHVRQLLAGDEQLRRVVSEKCDPIETRAMIFQLTEARFRAATQEKVELLKQAALGILNPNIPTMLKQMFLNDLARLEVSHISLARDLVAVKHNAGMARADFVPPERMGQEALATSLHGHEGGDYVAMQEIERVYGTISVKLIRDLESTGYVAQAGVIEMWKVTEAGEELIRFLAHWAPEEDA